MKKIFVVGAVVFVMGILAALPFYAFAKVTSPAVAEHLPGRVLVSFKPGVASAVRANELAGQGQLIDSIPALGVDILRVPEDHEQKVVEALSHNPNVEYAELDYLATAQLTPSDQFFTQQWFLNNPAFFEQHRGDIDAPEAWEIETGLMNTSNLPVKVAILDTGVSENHSDLSTKVVSRVDFTGTSVGDVYGHGTHVGGIVAAPINGHGVAGVCPDCQLLSVKVLNDSGSGAYSWIANGVTYAISNGAKVINLSLGGPTKSRTLENAMNLAWNNGVLVVAAAGNSGNQSKTYPAAYESVVAVAATDRNDQKASFSEYGSWVDLAAPGLEIVSTWNDSDSPHEPQPFLGDDGQYYKNASGTSMSTPVAAGVAGLIWATGKYSTVAEVRQVLQGSADPIVGTETLWQNGRVNALNALNYVITAPSPSAPTKGGGKGQGR